jgi:hypothetical protein
VAYSKFALKRLFLAPILFIDFVLGPFSFGILLFDTKFYFIHVSVAKFEEKNKIIRK